ncbi:MAG: amino acid ABC transporter ATP-binding protein [Clostridia bacterium]|nr:amino acid ABC transporter ATP-binding protein [Clostridia bacterium]
MIKIRGLRKSFGGAVLLNDINVDINKGDVIAVIGPSGTGKSTFVRCINRLETPDRGEIIIAGKNVCSPNADLPAIRRRIGMVFQELYLFPHKTAIENVMCGPVDLLGKTPQEAYDRGMELLDMVGLTEKAMSYPNELSGGQQQRIEIARAVSMDPDIILLDEPTSALDPTMVGEVQSVIRALAAQGRTMIIVTHDMQLARDASNRVFFMSDGGIYEDGPPSQVFDAPKREKTRLFVQQLKILKEEFCPATFDYLHINSKIESFAESLFLDKRSILNLQGIFEEIVVQGLRPSRYGKMNVTMTIEHSERRGTTELCLVYNGDKLDPTELLDDISKTIVEARSEYVEHTYENGMNRFVVGI